MAQPHQTTRINSIEISNYKGIDNLSLSFPAGKMASDPDINVLGSMNGIGKTSTLECCALLLLAASSGKEAFRDGRDLLGEAVKSGEKSASIKGEITVGKSKQDIELSFDPEGNTKIVSSRDIPSGRSGWCPRNAIERIQGLYSDPVSGKNFFFLHSYRKVQEGRPDLGSLLEEENNPERSFYPRRLFMGDRISFSMFKSLIVRHMMENADLFEQLVSANRQAEEDKRALATLNGLLKTYADVTIGKLRPFRNNTIDVLVERKDSPGNGFSIDGLSSGQKEIIASLFMIWNKTYQKPSVVLIDEPELHLNAQWHAGFVQKLLDIAPDNQYILATHAEAVMDSVRPENRHLLFR